jgi:hypothetical protein
MRGAYHWDENNVSSADLHEARLDEIWSSMPLDLKKEIFFNGGVDVFLFAAVYSRWLDEGKWLRVDIKEELNDGHGGGFGVAQELEERFVLRCAAEARGRFLPLVPAQAGDPRQNSGCPLSRA